MNSNPMAFQPKFKIVNLEALDRCPYFRSAWFILIIGLISLPFTAANSSIMHFDIGDIDV